MLILTQLKNRLFTFGFALLLPLSSYATVVEVRTVLGTVTVNLFDETTPATVENFLVNYVQPGAYANNVVHRVEPGFVVQAGGFQYNGETTLDGVPASSPVTNEPELSNVRGTIAMAKLGGDPNSATTQWFFNLSDNSANLDVQNGGFTVFGQVIEGMDVVDAIAAVNLYNLGGAFASIPLRNYTGTETIDDTHLVIITDIVVIDATTVTNSQLNPVANTLLNAPTTGGDSSTPSSGGGGSVGWLLGLVALVLMGKRKLVLTAS